jgi:AcrR family transcriptional regulator
MFAEVAYAVRQANGGQLMDAGSPPAEAAGRRARARSRTWRELKAAALAEVREVGPSRLALRSVARRLGMSPAGLYRYVESRDGLLTMLIADGYDDLADHLEVALGTPVADLGARDRPDPDVAEVAPAGEPVEVRLRTVALAYRGWALGHPNEFGLLFGDPIPGYVAPEGGPTVRAMSRVGDALARPLREAAHAGRLPLDPALRDPVVLGPPGAIDALLGPGDDLALGPLLLLSWGRLHGQVSLEVFGHHDWLYPDGCEALYQAELSRMLRDLGLIPRVDQ